MNFNTFETEENQELSEINMVPLIDVMLVLLVIFMITTPLLTHSVKIDLPKASSHPTTEQNHQVQLTIDAQGQFHWNSEKITSEQLEKHIERESKRTPQPTLYLNAEKTIQYQIIADVMAKARKAGLARIAFVSEPHKSKFGGR